MTQILKEITQLNSSKAGQSTDIPTKIIKQNSSILADFILTSFNHVSRYMFQQISKLMELLLSKCQCGFRKGYNTQYCLLDLVEKWKWSVDKGSSFGARLTDLSKEFDCLSHKLLIAKLHAYGFSLNALRLVHSYLTNRKHRTKIIIKYSS